LARLYFARAPRVSAHSLYGTVDPIEKAALRVREQFWSLLRSPQPNPLEIFSLAHNIVATNVHIAATNPR
jgi:hypothetical protein